MKKVLSLILVIALLVSTTVTVNAAQTYVQAADEAANVCFDLSLIVGSGEGLTPEYLASSPKRYGGAKLIVALRGFLDEALVYNFTENFNDYMDLSWTGGQHILGYLKEHPAIGYNGKPGNIFDPNANMSVKEYYKLMLVSLGYTENTDFSWGGSDTMPDVMTMARQAGLTWLNETDQFTMEKMCIATVEALKATMNGSDKTLAQMLVEQGAIDAQVCLNYGLIDALPAVDPSTATVDNVAVTLSGSTLNESDVVSGAFEMDVIIINTKFQPTIGEDNAITTAFLAGLSGSDMSGTGFDDKVLSNLSHLNLIRVDDTKVKLLLPATADYAIAADETITLTIDPTVFTQPVTNTVSGMITVVEDSVMSVAGAVDVTITNDMEADLVAGSTELTITVTDLTFVAEIGSDHSSTTTLLSGIVGSLSGAGSFADEVALTHVNVTRNTATELSVMIPASAGYSINADEMLTVTVSDAMFTEALSAPLSDSVTVKADPTVEVGLEVSGTNLAEADLVAGNTVLTLTLTNGTFVADLGADNANTTALLAGISGATIGAGTFNNEVTLTHANVTRVSGTEVTVAIPATAGYSITANETLTVTLGIDLVDELIVAPLSDTVSISKDAQTITITTDNMTEFGVKQGNAVFVVTLNEGAFADTLGENNDITTEFIEGITGPVQPKGAIIVGKGFDQAVSLGFKEVKRVSDTEVQVTIPESDTYNIVADELITVSCTPAVLGKDAGLLKPGLIETAVKSDFTIVDSGAGTEAKPYIITTYDDLDMIRNSSSASFVLGNDIDCVGEKFVPIPEFTGTLDGMGFEIQNLDLDVSEVGDSFIRIIDGATISNITFKSVTIDNGSGDFYAGVLACQVKGASTLNNVNVSTASIGHGLAVGGLVSHILDGTVTITDCTVSSLTVDNGGMVGGLVGIISSSTVDINTSSANGSLTADSQAGGIVALINTASVVNIRETTSYGKLHVASVMGGIVGEEQASELNIIDSYGKVNEYQVAGATYTVHRVLGKSSGTVQLVNNDGYQNAVLNEEGVNVASWVSDASGPDGEDKYSITDLIVKPIEWAPGSIPESINPDDLEPAEDDPLEIDSILDQEYLVKPLPIVVDPILVKPIPKPIPTPIPGF